MIVPRDSVRSVSVNGKPSQTRDSMVDQWIVSGLQLPMFHLTLFDGTNGETQVGNLQVVLQRRAISAAGVSEM